MSENKSKKKDKYAVNILFDKEQEARIRACAKANDLKVASFIKMCVAKQLDKEGF